MIYNAIKDVLPHEDIVYEAKCISDRIGQNELVSYVIMTLRFFIIKLSMIWKVSCVSLLKHININ